MAETADIELSVGAIADVASITKAGEQIRSMLNKYIMESLGAIGIRGTTLSGFLTQARNAKTGLEVYSAYRNAQTEVKSIKADLTKMEKAGLGNMSSADTAVLNAVSDTLGIAVNTSRRTEVYAKINDRLSTYRKRKKEALVAAADAAKVIPGVSDYRGSLFPDTQDISKTIYKNALTPSERTAAAVDAISAFGSVSASPDRISQAIYRNIYSKGFTADERARAEEDARAVWAVKENTKALKTLSVIATGVVATSFKTMANVLPTYWHESVTRSTFGHLAAAAERTQIVGSGVGSIAGNVIGGLIGGLIGGPAGATIGASVLGSVGGTIGSLSGKYEGERLQSVQKTIAQINDRYRAQGIYGGQYSVGYANAVQETGMASSGDVEKMVHNSATLGARMMFGQVGDNEMLMYSLMPGYFAAAMAGKTGPELADAFAADLNRLPPQLRVHVAESVGGGSLGMMAYAASPTFGYVQGQAGSLSSIDAAIMRAGAGYHVQGGVRGVLDRIKEEGAIYGDISYGLMNPESGVYLPTGDSAELTLASPVAGKRAVPRLVQGGIKDMLSAMPTYSPEYYKTASRKISSSDAIEAGDAYSTIRNTRDRILQHQTININVDGETIKSQDVDNVIQEGTLLTQTLGF